MQQLTAAPREALSSAQVLALLSGPDLTVQAGLERLSSSLVVLEDLSDHLADGQVERVMEGTIPGTCRLLLSTELAWGTVLVKPYMILSSAGVSARFNCGVYALTTPRRVVGSTPELFEVAGFDRVYLLDRPVGDSYSVAAGTGVLAAVRTVFAAAGLSGLQLDGSAEASTLPAAMSWPLLGQGGATTWLRIVNDLLNTVNYRGIYTDENGVYRSEPYATPAQRAVEYEFDADDEWTIVGEQRTLVEDQWRTPNKWVFVQRNAPAAPVEGAGIYTVTNQADGPTSIAARGLVWAAVHEYDAADHASLVGLGDRRVAADRRETGVLEVTTSVFPLAGHVDVFTYQDAELGGPRKVQARRWRYSLRGGDVEWLWETVS